MILLKVIGYLFLAILLIALYFLPTIIAYRRHHAYKGIIFVINLVFGLTGLGWAGSLIWAIFPAEKSLIDPFVGNPTGTGIRNAGDTLGSAAYGKIRGEGKEASATKDILEAAELFQNGHITEDEYKDLKRKIINRDF
jgi:Superinfection immunity protein